jgi:archaellum component FlaC
MDSKVLPECSTGFTDLAVRVGVFEHDMKANARVIEKLTESIEKIEELSNNLFRLVSLHEQRSDSHEEAQEDLEVDLKDLSARLEVMAKDTHLAVDHAKKELFSRLDGIHKELLEHIVIRTTGSKTTVEVQGHTIDTTKSIFTEVEKWKYMVLGGAVVIGWLLAHAPWGLLVQLFIRP